MPQIENDYIKTGKIKYVYGDFPLEAIHRYAFKAALAAHCAGAEGKYWEMHDQLFANQAALKPEDLLKDAEAIGLDKTKFQQCVESGKYDPRIRKMMAQGEKAGVLGTPTLVVGVVQPDLKSVKVLKVMVGLQPPAAFKEAIDSALASTGK
jgi:protein-disulfide isomerase